MNESRKKASTRSVTWLSVALVLAALLSSCDVPARVTQGPVTSWIPPKAGPELVAVPVEDRSVIMEPGLATPEEVDAALSPVRGYLPGSGVHLATYPGASQVDIYRFTSTDPSFGLGPDGPVTCTAEVEVGQRAVGWSCVGGVDAIARYGILGMGRSQSDRGDHTMTIEVGTEAESTDWKCR